MLGGKRILGYSVNPHVFIGWVEIFEKLKEELKIFYVKMGRNSIELRVSTAYH